MEEKTCPACKAENDDDAAYCDQCGQPLTAPESVPEDAGGACPACGGVVESRGDGKGVCRSCGLELFETEADEPSSADPGTVARLTAAILRGANAGVPLEQAVADGCREVFAASAPKDAPPAPAAAGEPLICPLCGAEGPAHAERCAGCGLWFGEPHGAHACPRCDREVRGGKCECGAILTLPKLLEYVEPAVRFVCSKCKAPYAVSQPKCPDCGGGLLSAERIKAFAASAAA
jgi:predicted amidophosphoribosyltransferase